MITVKICGITNLNDARDAIDAGADALGFNFYQQSSRYVSPDQAASMIVNLPSEVSKVGVFVNASMESILETAAACGLTAIQLHGDESMEFVSELRKLTDADLIKAFRVSDAFSPADTSGFDVHGVLLDGFSNDARGGTGERFDWKVAEAVRSVVDRLWLAGGLTCENVGTAVVSVRPYAVDACSSLESSPGIKDHAKVRKFIMEAKRA